jgi:drug/metabolite transporter (DMT)-like permease
MTRATGTMLFLAMCLIWGLTWLAIKTGIERVPPLFFAGTRFAVAGTLLFAWSYAAGERPAFSRADWRAFLVATLLLIVVTYSLLFWGMLHVASGLAAVINLALTPTALLALGLAYGEERFSLRQTMAISLGIAGLVVLFRPGGGSSEGAEPWGIAAIVGGSVAYAWGSVLSRPLLRRYSPLCVSAVTCLLGGLILIAMALILEPIGRDTLLALAAPAVLASWLFLVLIGSLVAFTIYLRLVRDWGAARAGLYAFVSPTIAVVVGITVSGERPRTSEFIGMAIMLAATWFALGRPLPRLGSRGHGGPTGTGSLS